MRSMVHTENASSRELMCILIVDDNRDILDLLDHVLSSDGYKVIAARDGFSALEQERLNNPDLVILDVNLPGINGWDVCRIIKQRRDVPVMLLTVRAEMSDMERSREVGAEDHILKPFEIPSFLERIERFATRSLPYQ